MNNHGNPNLSGDLRRWARNIELYFERHSFPHILAKGFPILVSVAAIIVDARNVLGEAWVGYLIRWLPLVLLVAALLLDYGHVRLAANRLKEIRKRDRHITSLKNLIRQAGKLSRTPYRLREWRIRLEIDAEGNSKYTREAQIELRKKPVYTMQMMVGAVAGGQLIDSVEQLNFVAKNRSDGAPLLWVCTVDTPDRKEITIILDPPVLKKENPGEVIVTLDWPGLWRPLVENGADEGELRVDNRTRILEMGFYLYHNFEFTGFRISPKIGDCEIGEDDTDRSYLIFRASNVRKGLYHYRLFCKRREPS